MSESKGEEREETKEEICNNFLTNIWTDEIKLLYTEDLLKFDETNYVILKRDENIDNRVTYSNNKTENITLYHYINDELQATDTLKISVYDNAYRIDNHQDIIIRKDAFAIKWNNKIFVICDFTNPKWFYMP